MNNGDPRTKPSCVACGSGETWEYDRDAKLAGWEYGNESVDSSSYMEIMGSDGDLTFVKLSSLWSSRSAEQIL